MKKMFFGPRRINNNINNDRVKLILREIKEYFAIIRSHRESKHLMERTILPKYLEI